MRHHRVAVVSAAGLRAEIKRDLDQLHTETKRDFDQHRADTRRDFETFEHKIMAAMRAPR